MKQEYCFRYSQKQVKKLEFRMLKPAFISLMISLGSVLVNLLVSLVFLIFTTDPENNPMKTFWLNYHFEMDVAFFSIFLAFLFFAVLLVFLCQNYSESYLRREGRQKVMLDGKHVVHQIEYGDYLMDDEFYAMRIRKTKNLLLVYKNFHSYIAIPLEAVQPVEKKGE